MTPKEKSERLVQQFIYRTTDYVNIDDAKKCALIAVDEIINIWEYSDTQEKWWWQQVRKEIEKL